MKALFLKSADIIKEARTSKSLSNNILKVLYEVQLFSKSWVIYFIAMAFELAFLSSLNKLTLHIKFSILCNKLVWNESWCDGMFGTAQSTY